MAKKIFISLFVAFTVILYYIAYKTKFQPAYDVMHELGDEMYTSPFSRIIPYFIGIGSGWVLYNCKHILDIDKVCINFRPMENYSIL